MIIDSGMLSAKKIEIKEIVRNKTQILAIRDLENISLMLFVFLKQTIVKKAVKLTILKCNHWFPIRSNDNKFGHKYEKYIKGRNK